jgi:hypothetical protein
MLNTIFYPDDPLDLENLAIPPMESHFIIRSKVERESEKNGKYWKDYGSRKVKDSGDNLQLLKRPPLL